MIKFNFNHIRGDVFGGITAGIVALPLALAFGSQTELGAEAGLYGAIAIGFFAALLGGTETQISGPTGPMTVVSIVVILAAIDLTGGQPGTGVTSVALGVIIATFLLAGAIELLLGVFGLGKYVKYIPYPVISGFMSGIGVIIIFLQIFDGFGYGGNDAPKTIVDIVMNVDMAVANANWTAFGLTLATIAIIYIFPRITKAVPSTLVALIVVSLAAYLLKLDVPIIGDIPTGIPEIKAGTIFEIDWGNSAIIGFIAKYGFILAALGAIDSLLTSIVADNLTKTRHNSNQELIGQGIGNMASAFIGGLPGAGATMRTVVNVNSGGITRISGVIHAFLLLGILLGLSVFVGQIPKSVLAGILITVGIGIIDYKGIRDMKVVPKADSFIMIVVLVMTVFVDLLQAVAVGMILASILFMKKISDVVEYRTSRDSDDLKTIHREEAWEDELNIPEGLAEKIYIKHPNGPLFFGFSNKFQELIQSLPKVEVVIFRMDKVPYMDQSGLYALEDAIRELQLRGEEVALTGLQKQPYEILDKTDILEDRIGEDHVFDTFEECIEWVKTLGFEDGTLVNPKRNGNK